MTVTTSRTETESVQMPDCLSGLPDSPDIIRLILGPAPLMKDKRRKSGIKDRSPGPMVNELPQVPVAGRHGAASKPETFLNFPQILNKTATCNSE